LWRSRLARQAAACDPFRIQSHFNTHAAILPESVKTQKPMVGFQACFFVMGPIPASLWPSTACKAKKTKKQKKHEKKWCFVRAPPLFFCQTGPFLGHF
jgi:hypothetical protein